MSVQRALAAAQIPPERLGPADATALATQAARLRLDLRVALASLASDDLVHTGADGAITVACPFSGRPTAHRVQLDVHEVHAICAIEALGMAPMFGRPIRVESSDPVSGDTVRVELAPDSDASWTPQEAVVVSGSSCAEQYLSARPDVRGIVISIPEAIEAGRCVFGDPLSEIR
ncbi:MAG TPA: organomercurial lyase [Gaiellaceae bacterium]|nr:organomercurial lyase [Gaiellaceae bacterium]